MSALAGLLLVLVLPALAGAVLLSGSRRDAAGVPGDVVPDLALSRGLACGIATWLLGSGLLTRTVGLTATSVWVWDAVIGAASLVVLLLPQHRARLRAALGPVGRRLAEVCALTALVYLPLGYAIVRISWSPLGSTPCWYYYGTRPPGGRPGLHSGDVDRVRNDDAVPQRLSPVHHRDGDAAPAASGGPIAVITTVNLIGVLLLGLGTVALTTALGAGRGAALLAVPVAVAAGVAPLRLASYRPEGFALGVALLLVALGIDWLHSRNRGSLVGAALLAATLSQVHGIAALTSGVMVAAAALVSLARGPRAEAAAADRDRPGGAARGRASSPAGLPP
jgi:hypothetical protein